MDTYRRMRGGYTIIEVIIVLTVSSILFAASVVGYSLQNRRTEFTDSVNNFAQDIQDVLNDVETGFYPTNNNFQCTAPSGGGYPDPNQVGSTEQGANTDCIFLGRAIQFAPSGTNTMAIDVYTIVGRSVIGGTTDPVTSVDDAFSVALNRQVARKSLTAGVHISSVTTPDGHNLAGVAMVSNSGGVGTGLNSRASLAAINGSLGITGTSFMNRIKIPGVRSSNITEASNGVNICLKEGGTGGRTAIVELATNSSQIIVNTDIDKPCS